MNETEDGKPPSCIYSARMGNDSNIKRERDIRYLCCPLITRWFVGNCHAPVGILHILNSIKSGDLD